MKTSYCITEDLEPPSLARDVLRGFYVSTVDLSKISGTNAIIFRLANRLLGTEPKGRFETLVFPWPKGEPGPETGEWVAGFYAESVDEAYWTHDAVVNDIRTGAGEWFTFRESWEQDEQSWRRGMDS